MKVLKIFKKWQNEIQSSIPKEIDIDEAIQELDKLLKEKAMYENIITLIDIECRKQAMNEPNSYELKIFAKMIKDIILNNYISDIKIK